MDSPKFVVQMLQRCADDAFGQMWEDTHWRPNVAQLKTARAEYPSETYRVVMVVDEGMESHLG